MAARKIADEPRFYVYKITDDDGVFYVGKGSGSRINVQIRKFSRRGEIVGRYKTDREAFAAERALIAELSPRHNICPGGNGGTARRRKSRRRECWEVEIDRVGVRVYAAKALLRFETANPGLLDPSKIDVIRQVADGCRA
jgi:hypothetical protein